MVFPADFVPVLEDTGMIVRVGAWIIDERLPPDQRLEPRRHRDVRVAVNVASRQFVEGDLEQATCAMRWQKHQVAPELLELELTETALMSNAERTITGAGQPEGAGHQSRSTISAPAIRAWPT
jgi:EAL domain-containing protein (putative c-di-GMP-specific phosphodiesterase class I)